MNCEFSAKVFCEIDVRFVRLIYQDKKRKSGREREREREREAIQRAI